MTLGKESRRALAKAQILDAAWTLAHTKGLASFTLKEVATSVGVQAPSLHSYFGSKHSIYDAMFYQGNTELLARMRRIDLMVPAQRVLQTAATEFMTFCLEDSERYQLLFQHPIPDFEPGAEAYAPAQELYFYLRDSFGALGITEAQHVDLWMVLMNGLAAQQLANDPGSSRWAGLVEHAVNMYSGHVLGTGNEV